MRKDFVFWGVFWVFFASLAVFTFIKTRTPKIKEETLREFEDFYFERQLKQGIIKDKEDEKDSKNSEVIEYIVQKNDTLEGIFSSFEFAHSDYRQVISLLYKNVKNFTLIAGQKFELSYSTIISYSEDEEAKQDFLPPMQSKNQTNIFNSISFQNKDGVFEIARKEKGFEFNFISFQKAKRPKLKSVSILSSIYDDGIKAGLSPNLLENLIRIYSFDVDFQRDIRSGDTFEVLYEEIYDEKTGQKLLDGDILFSKINLNKSLKKDFHYYLFNGQYYDEGGSASAKSFLKTPIPGARLSSGFGMRKHPILGFTKLHTGIDFAAPVGTPIFAAASGTITFIGWSGTKNTGYGRRVVVKHSQTYSTSYSHMNGFRKNLEKGSKVKQGEVIGYVGATGYATGPHLHYEVIKNGVMIDPKNATSFTLEKLIGQPLKEFKIIQQKIDQKRNEIKG